MLEDPRARALLIHVAAYLVVVAICAGVNLWFAPDKLWFVWVALGWGIGVAAHALALVLRRSGRRERIFSDRRARGFTVHLFAYVAVVILLFVVNLTVTPNRWWFYWVALGWGAGVALHAWLVFGRDHSDDDIPQRRASATPTPKTRKPKKRTSTAKKRTAPRKTATSPRKRPKPKA
jgi:Kef-type K+ transport system membrane component KefB